MVWWQVRQWRIPMMGDKKKSHTHQGVRGSNSLHSSHSDSRSEVTLVEFVQPNKTYYVRTQFNQLIQWKYRCMPTKWRKLNHLTCSLRFPWMSKLHTHHCGENMIGTAFFIILTVGFAIWLWHRLTDTPNRFQYQVYYTNNVYFSVRRQLRNCRKTCLLICY